MKGINRKKIPSNLHIHLFLNLQSFNNFLAPVKEKLRLQSVHNNIQYKTKIVSLKGTKLGKFEFHGNMHIVAKIPKKFLKILC